MLKIKLMRTGKKNQPSYRIVVAEARSKRDGRYTDQVGYYLVIGQDKTIKIDQKKYQDWISKGAQPTDTVASLYRKLYGKTA